MERERALHPDAEGLLPDGESLASPGALALEDDALEDLDPGALALDHLEMDAHGVPRLELRDVRPHLGALDCLDDLAHRVGGRRRPPRIAREVGCVRIHAREDGLM